MTLVCSAILRIHPSTNACALIRNNYHNRRRRGTPNAARAPGGTAPGAARAARGARPAVPPPPLTSSLPAALAWPLVVCTLVARGGRRGPVAGRGRARARSPENASSGGARARAPRPRARAAPARGYSCQNLPARGVLTRTAAGANGAGRAGCARGERAPAASPKAQRGHVPRGPLPGNWSPLPGRQRALHVAALRHSTAVTRRSGRRSRRTFSTAVTRVVLGTAPMMVSIFWPFLNTWG